MMLPKSTPEQRRKRWEERKTLALLFIYIPSSALRTGLNTHSYSKVWRRSRNDHAKKRFKHGLRPDRSPALTKRRGGGDYGEELRKNIQNYSRKRHSSPLSQPSRSAHWIHTTNITRAHTILPLKAGRWSYNDHAYMQRMNQYMWPKKKFQRTDKES